MVALSNYHDMYAAIDSNYNTGYDYLPGSKQNDLTMVKNLANVTAFQPLNRNLSKRIDDIYVTFNFAGTGLGAVQNSVGLYGSVSVWSRDMGGVNVDPRNSGDTIVFSADGTVWVGGAQQEPVVPIIFTTAITMKISMKADGFNGVQVSVDGVTWGDLIGPALQYIDPDPDAQWIPFISVDNGGIGSIVDPEPGIYSSSQSWMRPAGSITEYGKLFLRTSTAIGVSWTVGAGSKASYQVYNSDTDVSVQTGSIDIDPFNRFTGLQPDTYYNIFYTPSANNNENEYNLLNGVKTSGSKVLFKFTGTFNSDGQLLLPIDDIESLSTPYLIAVESMQLVHNASYLPINAYKLTSTDIGFEQYINYAGGQTLNYISPVADTNLGTQLPIVLKTGLYENPGHITFSMSYDTVIGTNIPAQLITYSQVTFVVYTGQLYLFGIN